MTLVGRARLGAGLRLVSFVAVLLVLGCVASLAAASDAQAHIYWTTDSGTIGRSSWEGTAVNQSFVPGASGNTLAVDSTHIYWASTTSTTIARANLDGTGAAPFLTTAHGVGGIASDGTHLYWSNYFYGNSIGRANLDGTDVNQNFITVGNFPSGIAVDGTHIYWGGDNGQRGTIGRANLDGTGVNNNFIQLFSLSDVKGVAVDGSHIYWVDQGYKNEMRTVGRANLDGSGVNPYFITGLSEFPSGVAVTRAHVFWGNRTTIGRANLDGSGVNQSFIAGSNGGVAGDPGPPHPTETSFGPPFDPPFGCSPAGVPVGYSTTCTVEVVDADPNQNWTPPHGTVSFSAPLGGSFSPTSCTLTPSSPEDIGNSSVCSVTWSPPANALPGTLYRIDAHYNGDDDHLPARANEPSWDSVQIVNAGGGGPQMPIDKAQCSEWLLYRTSDGGQIFKSRGDCVSYVATHGKNPPARR